MASATLLLSSVTLPPIHHYPSTPLMQFPPPMPTTRRLRERCGFNLKIKTTFSQPEHPAPWCHKGHLQPHRNHLPRRRKGAKRIVFHHEEEHVAEAAAAASTSVPVSDLPKIEDRCMQEVVPGLSIAFNFSGARSDAAQLLQEGFTHLIDICYAAESVDEFGAGSMEQAQEGRLHRLCLTLPSSARVDTPQRAGLALTDAQLRSARDFVAQALPYSSQGTKSDIRLLIATPSRRPTDAMSVAGCYLSLASGKSVETVLRYIDEEETVLSVWKGEVSEDEVEKVEHVARLWSSLSTVTDNRPLP